MAPDLEPWSKSLLLPSCWAGEEGVPRADREAMPKRRGKTDDGEHISSQGWQMWLQQDEPHGRTVLTKNHRLLRHRTDEGATPCCHWLLPCLLPGAFCSSVSGRDRPLHAVLFFRERGCSTRATLLHPDNNPALPHPPASSIFLDVHQYFPFHR